MHIQSINKSTPAAGTSSASWVLITGASSGFGEEFARQYAEQGHSLVLIARRLDRADNAAARNLIRDNHVYVACQTDDDLPYVLKYAGEDNIVIG